MTLTVLNVLTKKEKKCPRAEQLMNVAAFVQHIGGGAVTCEKEHWLRFLGNPGPEESLGTAVIPACPPIWDKWPANGIRSSLHTTSPPQFLPQHLTSSTDRMKERKASPKLLR